MKLSFKNFLTTVSFIVFVWTSIQLILLYYFSFHGNIILGQFDQSLKLISGVYASQKFVPYNDFAFVYPPGQIIINSFLNLDALGVLKLNTIFSILISGSLLFFIVYKIKSLTLLAATSTLLVVNFNVLSSPYTESFWIMLVILILCFIGNNYKRYLNMIFVISTLLLLLKWDRVISLGFATGAVFIFSLIANKRFTKDVKEKLKKITIAIFFSALTSFFALITYLSIVGSDINKALYFIFNVPLKISAFRDLPLFSSSNISDGKIIFLFLGIFLILSLLLIKSFINKKVDKELLFSIILTISTLPYALGRSDVSHFLPFITTLTICLAFYARKNKFFGLLLIGSLIYIFYAFNLFTLPKANANLFNNIQDCMNKTKNLSYETIFVGRKDYSNFLINNAALYLVNVKAKPATSFISDEPGLQNNCIDSTTITNEINNAKMPMLAFIETSPQRKEPNLSSKMKSCRKIENYLESSKYKKIGTCKSYESKFEIRIYEKNKQ